MKYKRLLISAIVLAFATMCLAAQEKDDLNWIDFPNAETLDSDRVIRVQHNLFIDPFGKAPNGSGGRQFGYEFTAIMGPIYVAPSISTFPQLKDGYVDLVGTIGINWYMFRTSAIRYYSGVRLGGEFRADFHPIIGASLGADLKLITFKGGSSLHIGGEVWVDHRAALADQFYGDSSGHDGGTIFTNSQARENGKIKIGFRF